MATLIDPGDKLFLDTSFAIALTVTADSFHAQAVELSYQIERAKAKIITTRGVFLEIGNALSPAKRRSAAVKFSLALENSDAVEIEPLTDELYAQGFDLFIARPDQDWSLVDCISFTVMKDWGITKALTADHHFEQAGFEILLKDP